MKTKLLCIAMALAAIGTGANASSPDASIDINNLPDREQLSKRGKSDLLELFYQHIKSSSDSISALNCEADALAEDRDSLDRKLELFAVYTDETIEAFRDSVAIDKSMPYVLKERQKVINTTIEAKRQLTELQETIGNLSEQAADMSKYAADFNSRAYIAEKTDSQINSLLELLRQLSPVYSYYLSPVQQDYVNDINTTFGNLIEKFY